ncbi:hypothetical protein I6F11_23385 [Ensifer sp. NBAIM29]|nr:hypothetical protein [Ensifer sp. NBAIM29]
MTTPKARTILYLRAIGSATKGGAEFQRTEQQRACTQAAILAGAQVRRDSDGEPQLLNSAPMIETISGSDRMWRQIVETLTPADTVVVATLGVLGDVPSRMVAHLSQAVATGCKLIVADLPHIDLQTIRSVALSFTGLEEKAERLQTELDGFFSARHEERRFMEREIKKSLIDALFKRGVDLTDLIPEPDGRKASKAGFDDPIHGRMLRGLRESLELSASEAGEQLLPLIGAKPMSKQTISGLETGRDTGDRAALYETALRAEIARRKRDAKIDRQIAKTKGQPLSEVERKLTEGVANAP